MILKLLISVVFVGAAVQKFTGKVAPNWERWGYSRQFMYATGIAELVALALFWWPGLELVGTAGLGLVLLGALATLIRHREGPSHIALSAVTLLLVMVQAVPVNGGMTCDGERTPARTQCWRRADAEATPMKRIIAVTAVAVSLAAGSFAGGTWWSHRSSGAAHASAHAATVYTCPMHPDYRSDHPGDCPSCGMALEAVRAGGAAGGDVAARALPHGAVQVSPDRQQAIGVRLGVVTRLAGTRLLRTTGRVAPDENRTYPIVAAVSGWVRNVESVTTGDAVKRDQVLASFVAPEVEFRSAQQSYYTGLEAFYRMAVTQTRSRSHGRRRTPPCAARRSTGWPTCCGTWASPTRNSGKWASAATSCRTSASSRRWTASCCSAASRPASGSIAASSSTGSRISTACGFWPTCTATSCRSSAAAPPRGSPRRERAAPCRRR